MADRILVQISINGGPLQVIPNATVGESKYGAPQIRLLGNVEWNGKAAATTGQVTTVGFVPASVKAERKAAKALKMNL